MKNNLIIDQKYTTIMVLNIPDDYPLIIIYYKNLGEENFMKSFILRDIIFPRLKNKETYDYECTVSFFKDINKHAKFIPSQLIDVIEDGASLDKLIGYLSTLLNINNKTNPNDEVDLDVYLLKRQNVLLNLGKDKVAIGNTYKVTIDGLPVGNYKITDIKNEQLTVKYICIGEEVVKNDTIIDFIDILHHDIIFERVD